MAKRSKPKQVTLTERSAFLLEIQLASFRKKFGRDPEDGDPVFFDPNADQPEPLPDLEFHDKMIGAMIASDTRPEIIFAYSRCGFLVSTCNKDKLDADQLAEWNAAVDEYFELEEKLDDEQ